jgi:hypothetical protein
MDYQKIYDSIINRAILNNRKKCDDVYYERHHIIPRCMGGVDKSSNLVLLTAKEHFICHRLLVNIYPNNNKLVRAVWAMSTMKNGNQSRYIVSSRVYEQLKKEYARINSEREITESFRKKISLTRTGKRHSEETKKNISEVTKLRMADPIVRNNFLNHCKRKRGIPLSQQTKDKLSKVLTGRVVSTETKERMKQSNKLNAINQKKPLLDTRTQKVYLKKKDLVDELSISNREYLKLLNDRIFIRIEK